MSPFRMLVLDWDGAIICLDVLGLHNVSAGVQLNIDLGCVILTLLGNYRLWWLNRLPWMRACIILTIIIPLMEFMANIRFTSSLPRVIGRTGFDLRLLLGQDAAFAWVELASHTGLLLLYLLLFTCRASCTVFLLFLACPRGSFGQLLIIGKRRFVTFYINFVSMVKIPLAYST